ncbi:MAG: hypothetical protein QOG86_647 [Thermoleophilaceae bacterium]|jgi:hypothetical protein|nr:hypothetical protein [Thermoleophilaceae bacterium]
MAIVMIQDTPAPAPDMEMYDKVNDVLGVDDNPPDGLIVHTASKTDDGMVIVDVWESREAFDRFSEERLMPAIREVMGDQGGGEPRSRFHEVHHLVKP